MTTSPQNKKRKGYPSPAQKARLVSILQEDKELCGGKFTASFTAKESISRWTLIAEELNSIPGGKKNYKEWRKTWQDMKNKAKKKDSEVRRSSNLTGGGLPPPPLTTEEEKVLNTISTSARTGHVDSQESQVHFFDPGSFQFDHTYVAGPSPLEVEIFDQSFSSTGAIPTVELEVNENIGNRELSNNAPKKGKKKSPLNKAIENSRILNEAILEKNLIKKNFYQELISVLKAKNDAFTKMADAITNLAEVMAKQT